jgi:uncharacterized protein (TIGR02265 family)
VEFPAEKRARMVFERDFMPAVFHEQVIRASLEAIHVKNLRVVARDTSFLNSQYDIAWD